MCRKLKVVLATLCLVYLVSLSSAELTVVNHHIYQNLSISDIYYDSTNNEFFVVDNISKKVAGIYSNNLSVAWVTDLSGWDVLNAVASDGNEVWVVGTLSGNATVMKLWLNGSIDPNVSYSQQKTHYLDIDVHEPDELVIVGNQYPSNIEIPYWIRLKVNSSGLSLIGLKLYEGGNILNGTFYAVDVYSSLNTMYCVGYLPGAVDVPIIGAYDIRSQANTPVLWETNYTAPIDGGRLFGVSAGNVNGNERVTSVGAAYNNQGQPVAVYILYVNLANGTEVWNKTILGAYPTAAYDITFLSDQGYVFSGVLDNQTYLRKENDGQFEYRVLSVNGSVYGVKHISGDTFVVAGRYTNGTGFITIYQESTTSQTPPGGGTSGGGGVPTVTPPPMQIPPPQPMIPPPSSPLQREIVSGITYEDLLKIGLIFILSMFVTILVMQGEDLSRDWMYPFMAAVSSVLLYIYLMLVNLNINLPYVGVAITSALNNFLAWFMYLTHLNQFVGLIIVCMIPSVASGIIFNESKKATA